jgi:DNA-binding XRE family transcriptional regulator
MADSITAPTFGRRLKALREERKETQVELAKAVGTDSGSVSRWERDRVWPHPAELIKLAEHFGVTLDSLMRGGGEQHPTDLSEFHRFLGTDFGRIAQQRQYISMLLSMRFTRPPTVKLYRAIVSALMLEDDDAAGK